MAYCGLDSHHQLDLHLPLMHFKHLETSLVTKSLQERHSRHFESTANIVKSKAKMQRKVGGWKTHLKTMILKKSVYFCCLSKKRASSCK